MPNRSSWTKNRLRIQPIPVCYSQIKTHVAKQRISALFENSGCLVYWGVRVLLYIFLNYIFWGLPQLLAEARYGNCCAGSLILGLTEFSLNYKSSENVWFVHSLECALIGWNTSYQPLVRSGLVKWTIRLLFAEQLMHRLLVVTKNGGWLWLFVSYMVCVILARTHGNAKHCLSALARAKNGLVIFLSLEKSVMRTYALPAMLRSVVHES